MASTAPQTDSAPVASPAATPAAPEQAAAVPGPNAPQPFQNASLYVGDLHPEVTEALLFDIFNAVGQVGSIRVCRDAVTRRSLGYAYVNFHQLKDAERAIDTMNYTLIKGRPCRIMWSQRDPSLRKTGAGNVFVKNLDLSIDNKALYDTFSLFGNILSCKVVTDKTGKSRGYGFVHFETTEAAEDAIRKINGMMIAGKEVFVGQFMKRNERPGNNNWTNLYVKNIPVSWDDEQFTDYFSVCGAIASSKVMLGPDGKSRGFGFVDFVEHDSAQKAVEDFHDKEMPQEEGEKAAEDEKKPAEDGEKADEEKKTKEEETTTRLVVCRAQKKAERERELAEKFEKLKVDQLNKYQGVNLYVRNLAEDVDDDSLRKEFTPYGSITSARVMREKVTGEDGKVVNGPSKGFGFVCFSTSEEATKAVTEMNGKMINNKPIFVALAQRKDARKAQLAAQLQQGRGGGRGMPMQQALYPAAPMYFAQGGMPQGQGRPNFYMPQMMPRGMMQQPQAGMPGFPRGFPMGAQGQPGFMQPGMVPQAGRGGAARRGRQAGPRGPGQAQAQHMKYNQNARNQPAPQAPVEQVQPGAPQPLTAEMLANASDADQKNMIGERIYPLVQAVKPELAGKITGMLLEMDNPELLHLLESKPALHTKVEEAVKVLEAAAK